MTFTFFKFHHDSTRSAGASGGGGALAPYRKIAPWATAWEGLCYYLSFVCIPCWNGRIRREQ